MKNEDKEKLSGIETKLDKLLGQVKSFFSPKAVIIQDANGVELDFTETETIEQIATGESATVDGVPAEGEYTLQDGTIYVFEGGVLTAINEPEQGNDDEAEMQVLKDENEDLKRQLSDIQNSLKTKENLYAKLKTEFVNSATELESIKMELTDIQSQFSIDQNKPNTPEMKDVKPQTKTKFSFKSNKK